MTKEPKSSGGLKGLLQRTGKFFYTTGVYARDKGSTAFKWGYQVGGQVAFAVATTSMVMLMPLLFEIAREGQMLESERAQVKDYKGRGYSDRQLQELGFSEAALHTPSVASLNKK
ncbi:predicted protein [Phaeodactylum tricornutum CCAP 1055/1]|jgi:hypothetical protein|uniref:Uncharacterized protein n=2 Tax=Phaeodactylum tricornutum TaxID=2850 RepID=B7FXS4_PHATC|nr:predicted protein [Phaeodactylum tricornutum CCAP 1055/1]XP_002185190.1 predicted protein [Phaeodactylum tricornutum CCAP 1055/1]EEC43322.1 predicted protein [Phaeodactylum tricornutum CCAP 1055/1]EEC48595.1 predicted protein [Phaeodactylum tricornutum CCAP 1055/1]|eukprot:XP_002179609.1 predicted protein [Phaeodactylum tricornutum CCAP 1055/1]